MNLPGLPVSHLHCDDPVLTSIAAFQ